MDIRYMKHKNESGQEERFYPITHKDAVVGLSDIPGMSENDLISTEAANEIVGDTPEIDPAIVNLINGLTAEDVGARPDDWMPIASDVGALPTLVDVVTVSSENDIINYFATLDDNSFTAVKFNVTASLNDVIGSNSFLALIYKANAKYGSIVGMSPAKGEIFNRLKNEIWSGWSTEFLPLTGGTLSGYVVLEKWLDMNNPNYLGRAKFAKNSSESTDNGTYIRDYDTNDNSLTLIIQALTNEIFMHSSANNTNYKIYGEHNKPSGTYTGNGSSSTRTIETGGIGNAIVIWETSSKKFTIATPCGAFYCTPSDTTLKVNSINSVAFYNGILHIGTNYENVNGNGLTYNYQIL